MVQIIREQVVTAGDGSRYLVTVAYDNVSGIPEDAELAVEELTEGTDAYDDYVHRAAEALGAEAGNLAFAHAFDIALMTQSLTTTNTIEVDDVPERLKALVAG